MRKDIKYMVIFYLVCVLWIVVCMAVLNRNAKSESQQTLEYESEQQAYETKSEGPEVVVLCSTDVNYEPKPVVSEYVERVVAAESRGESLLGQMAVAQCIRETAEATGQTTEQVVKVKNQYAQPVSANEVTDSVREACYRVFYMEENAVDDNIRYFYSTVNDFYSKWHEENLEYVCTIGNHKFFK